MLALLLLGALTGIVHLPVSAAADVPYSVSFEGINDKPLREALQAVSQAVALMSRPPASESLLRRRAEDDKVPLLNELRRQGYYNGTVTVDIRPGGRKARVVFVLDSGPVYRIDTVQVEWIGDGEDAATWPAPSTRLKKGQPGHADRILEEEQRLLRRLETVGFAFATVRDRDILVDHDRQEIDIRWQIEPGPQMRFGAVTVAGLRDVRSEAVLRWVPWRDGDLYDVEQVEALQNDLLRWGVFSGLRIDLEPEAARDNVAAAALHVSERKHRTIRLGARYRSDIGAGGLVAWEHRNLFRRGDSVELSVEGGEIEYAANAVFRKNHFLSRRQTLEVETRAAREDTEAYQSEGGEGRAVIERTWNPRLTLHGGLGYKYHDVEQSGLSEVYQLVYLTTGLDWNTSDSLLDPIRGVRLILEASPYHDVGGNDADWLATLGELRGYLRMLRAPRTVLAGRFTLGSLVSDVPSEIPADERLYAGGGGSVRGYAYQSIGPLTEDGTPLGGSFLAETSLEIRVNVRDPIGAVLFVDGGYVGDDWTPQSGEKTRWGAGAGLRYATGIGPIRLDVAVPLQRRKELDDRLQFYISLGQAF